MAHLPHSTFKESDVSGFLTCIVQKIEEVGLTISELSVVSTSQFFFTFTVLAILEY